MEKKTRKTFQEMMDEFDRHEQWCKDHPFLSMPERISDFVLYRIPYFYNEIHYSIKYGFQRMFRGYDDRYLFSYHTENTRYTLEVLKWMKMNKMGSPYTDDPEGVLKTKDTTEGKGMDKNWHKRWDEALDIMIEGFEALDELDDCFIRDENGEYDMEATKKKEKELWAKWMKGATLYIHNYRGIWD